jgi:hypothetical protein
MDAGPSLGDGGQREDGPSGDARVGPSNECKRGIAYGRNTAAGLEALSKGVHWWYNWATQPEAAVQDIHGSLGVEFVPMVWGGEFTEEAVLAELPTDATFVLGFNEPNFKTQANLTASEAAFRWPELERIADERGLQLVSPAVAFCSPASDCHDTDPIVYLDAFFGACQDCRVDYVAAHWYACDVSALRVHLAQLKKYDKPIWITEFACGGGDEAARSLDAQKQYMAEAVELLELDRAVARYAWSAEEQAIENVNLVDDQGALTELGELYLSLPHYDASCAR